MCYFCQVCGEKMKQIRRRHGGICCNSCAAFYQHSIEDEDKFECQNANNCMTVPSKKGRKCKRCRFQKCLEIGMISREFIQHIQNKKAMEKVAAVEVNGERATFASVTETILKACLKLTPLLEKYLRDGDSLIMIVALEAARDENLDSNEQLALLLCEFPITEKELPLFYHICMCKLEFLHLPEAEKLKMKESQVIGLQKLLTLTENIDRFFEIINISINFVSTFLVNYLATTNSTN